MRNKAAAEGPKGLKSRASPIQCIIFALDQRDHCQGNESGEKTDKNNICKSGLSFPALALGLTSLGNFRGQNDSNCLHFGAFHSQESCLCAPLLQYLEAHCVAEPMHPYIMNILPAFAP